MTATTAVGHWSLLSREEALEPAGKSQICHILGSVILGMLLKLSVLCFPQPRRGHRHLAPLAMLWDESWRWPVLMRLLGSVCFLLKVRSAVAITMWSALLRKGLGESLMHGITGLNSGPLCQAP